MEKTHFKKENHTHSTTPQKKKTIIARHREYQTIPCTVVAAVVVAVAFDAWD
jgi:hypothetical protein